MLRGTRRRIFARGKAERFPPKRNGKKPRAVGMDALIHGARISPDITLLNYNGDHGDIVSAYDYLIALSPYGLLQMSGNVRQWMSDWYQRTYYSISPYKNPQGPDSGEYKSLRGGAFDDDFQEVETTYRAYHEPTSAGQERGFRCVQSAK